MTRALCLRLISAGYVLLFCCSRMFAQEHVGHYNVENGLLSDITYCGLFDRNNYLWICTDRGLSRFNGTAFTHFTVKEGLPDNDVTGVKEDLTGVIWAEPFRREVAFLEPGKTLFTHINNIIHPDTVRKDGKYKVFPLPDSSVALMCDKQVIRLVKNKRWIASYRLPMSSFSDNPDMFRNERGDLVILGNRKMIQVHPSGSLDTLAAKIPYTRSEWDKHILWLYDSTYSLTCIDTRKGKLGTQLFKIRLADPVLRFGFWNDSLLIGNEAGQLKLLDYRTGIAKLQSRTALLAAAITSNDKKVKVIFTRGDGIYVFVKRESGYYQELSGAPHYLLQRDSRVEVLDVRSRWLYPQPLAGTSLPDNGNTNMSRFAEEINGQTWVYGSRIQVFEKGGMVWQSKSHSIKDFYRYNDSIRYLATSGGAYELNCYHDRDTGRLLLFERCTSISAGPDGSVFIGNYYGLLQRMPDSSIVNWRKAGFPEIRVVDLVYKNDILWIATAGKGLWALYNHRVQLIANESNGLASNVIEALQADDRRQLVLGYAKGVQRLSYRLEGGRICITELLTLHTAPGEGIRDLRFAGGHVYGMGNRGLLILPELLQEPVKEFRLQIDRVIVDGLPEQLLSRYELSTSTHDFSVSFSTVNYEQFPVRFRYRIGKGSWTYTSTPEASYHNLGSGDYRIEIQVLNNYGMPSDTKVLQVNIAYPFYLKAAFLLIATSALFFLTFFAFRLWYRYQYKKASKTLLQEKKLKELELAALKAQINPHFVFNCLNSIKGLIYEQRLDEADRYVDRFAGLFRSTLESSANPYQSLSQEIAYISDYLALEQVNRNDRFTFIVEACLDTSAELVLLPAMMLQPYVENAVKHGVATLRDRKGRIVISFEQDNDWLVCTISDNGVGRKTAALLQRRPGKGLPITERRASLYDIKTEITDNIPYGTIVRLTVPLKIQDTNQTS